MILRYHSVGVVVYVSARETYAWAHRPNCRWPCSTLAGKRFMFELDSRGNVVDYHVNGRYNESVDTTEFHAMMKDFTPTLKSL